MGIGNFIKSAASAVGKTAKKVAKGAYDYAKKNPDVVLAGASVVDGALSARRSAKFVDRARTQADRAYKERAPIRARALRDLAAERPDLSDVYEDRSNPFARKRASKRVG